MPDVNEHDENASPGQVPSDMAENPTPLPLSAEEQTIYGDDDEVDPEDYTPHAAKE